MDQDRKIVGAVLQSGRFYKAGDEAALAAILPRMDMDRLAAKGVLSGDWGQPATVTRLDGQPMVHGEDGLIHGDLTGDGSGVPLPPITGDEPNITGSAVPESAVPETPAPPPAKPAKDKPAKKTKKPTTKKGK